MDLSPFIILKSDNICHTSALSRLRLESVVMIGDMKGLWAVQCNQLYTAISINVVGLNLQTYESRPNGAMGIYCNLHISIEEIYKFVFLHVEYLFFFP